MPEEPIVPVIRRPENRRPSEDLLDRQRRIAREVCERFERKSEDREAQENKRNLAESQDSCTGTCSRIRIRIHINCSVIFRL